MSVTSRTTTGTRAVRVLRKSGITPGVIYGNTLESMTIEAPAADVTKVFHTAGRHHPIEITLDGKKKLAMIKQVALDPVKHSLLHIAFHVVSRREKVTAQIPVVIKNKGGTPAERAGLVLLQAIENVTVEALPSSLPEVLTVDGAKLVAEGDHVTVADIAPQDGVTITDEPSLAIATAYAPRALAAANEAAAGDAENEQEEVVAEETAPTTAE